MFVLIDTIDFVNSIFCIDSVILNCSALQLKSNANNPKTSEITFWGNKEFFSILLAFLVFAKISRSLFNK